MKLAVVGSRTFNDNILMLEYIHLLKAAYETLFNREIEIISGGAKGADSLAEKAALVSKIPVKVFKPDWDKYGKKAGMIRNAEIVDACDMVLAFWDGISSGTYGTINLARTAKKPTFIVYF